jgi:hypothetical protein
MLVLLSPHLPPIVAYMACLFLSFKIRKIKGSATKGKVRKNIFKFLTMSKGLDSCNLHDHNKRIN